MWSGKQRSVNKIELCGEVKNVSENYYTNLCAMSQRPIGVMDVHLDKRIIVQGGDLGVQAL